MIVNVFPNPYEDATPWGSLKIGGLLICNPLDILSPQLISIEGLEVEDEYNIQRPIGQSYAVAVFKGTKLIEGVMLAIEAPTKESFAALWDLWLLLAPAPGSNTSPTFTQVQVVPETTTGDGVGGSTASALPPEDDGADVDGWPKYPVFNIGPKPPTLSIEIPQMSWVGMHACSRKKWKGPTWRESGGSWRVELTVIQARPPVRANVGAQGTTGGLVSNARASAGPGSTTTAAAAAKASMVASPV